MSSSVSALVLREIIRETIQRLRDSVNNRTDADIASDRLSKAKVLEHLHEDTQDWTLGSFTEKLATTCFPDRNPPRITQGERAEILANTRTPPTIRADTTPIDTVATANVYSKWHEDAIRAKQDLRKGADLDLNKANRPKYIASIQLLETIVRRTGTWTQETYLARYSDAWREYKLSQPGLSQAGDDVTREARSKLSERFTNYMTREDESGRPVDISLHCLSKSIGNVESAFQSVEGTRDGPKVRRNKEEVYRPETSKQVFQDYLFSQDPRSKIIRSLTDEYHLVGQSLRKAQHESEEGAKHCIQTACPPI
ncbi:hypothetical protein I302_103071 [Kwoniella bestiolae CBS 10118]|uniref:Uncharacterized protein n=1 Tax=Kwoniella bestiolae CBS 10118 TaxID=1296100 RepID=A0A1B9GH35_9TREE|nr:hypothetical protein I302_01770 [Kwoniella bestiolae CBS 10118]OCF30251.1 hypothetical protein I302_01770 [Kwoniella bestiolae CBS 10118]